MRYSNEPTEIDRVRRFVKSAVEDGWQIRPTYDGHESVERAAKLERDGFTIQAITRDNRDDDRKRWAFEASLHMWGPDGISVTPPSEYDWNAITEGVRTCPECGTTDVDTFRVAFANRACAACRPSLAAKLETPGWCD